MPTGIALALPEGFVGLVHPRSGLAARHGITIVNAPGTIDAGYRGEILVNLVNLDPREAFTVRPRRPDRPARGPAGRRRRLRRGGFAPGQLPGGHWSWCQWRLRRPHPHNEGLNTPVAIFRRGKKSEQTDELDATHDSTQLEDATDDTIGGATGDDSTDATEVDAPQATVAAQRCAARPQRTAPSTCSEVDAVRGRPPRPRRPAHPRGGRHGAAPRGRRRAPSRSSAPPPCSATPRVQLQAFARPALEGHLGRDPRRDRRPPIAAQGGTADERRGPARHRAAHPDARPPAPTAAPSSRPPASPGVDGPRWFLRAVLLRPGRHRREAAAPLVEVVRASVVVRGDERDGAPRDARR